MNGSASPPPTVPRAIAVAAFVLAGGAFFAVAAGELPDPLGTLRALADAFSGDWRFPSHSAVALVVAAALWFAASGVGHLVLMRTGANETIPSFLARTALGALLGWIGMSLAALAVGLSGRFSFEGLGLLALVFAAIGARGWQEAMRDLSERADATERAENRARVRAKVAEADAPGRRFRATGRRDVLAEYAIGAWPMALALAIYAIGLPYAATPAVESDELRYHLAAPEAWIEAGRIHYLPYQAFSNFPFLAECLYGIAMAIQGTEAARVVHFAFLETSATLVGLLAFLLIRVGEPSRGSRRDDGNVRTVSALAGGAFAAIPAATILACWAFNDLALTAYFLAIVYLGALALVSRRPPPSWLAGAMAAGGLGTKYSMAPLLVAVFALFAVVSLVRRERGGIPRAIGFVYFRRAAFVAILLGCPWYVRNLVWTGNPVYPLAWSVFEGGEWSQENARFYAAKAAEKGYPAAALFAERAGDPPPRDFRPPAWTEGPAGKLFELAISPLAATFRPRAFEGHFLGPVPLMALAALAGALALKLARALAFAPRPPPSAFDSPALASRRLALALWIGGLLVGTWVYWFLTYRAGRLLLPTLGIAIAAGAWGARFLLTAFDLPPARKALGGLAAAVLAYCVLWSAGAIHGPAGRGGPAAVALGFERREDYLLRRVPYYEATLRLKEELRRTRGEKTLLIGEHRTLYFDNAVVASDWFDTPQPIPFLRESELDYDAIGAMRRAGITHVFVNQAELSLYIRRYFQPRFSRLTEYMRFEELFGIDMGQIDPELVAVWRKEFPDGRYMAIYRIAR